MNGLTAFFTHSSKRTHALSEYVKNKMPSVAPTRWNFTSRLVNTVAEYRRELIEFFRNCVKCSDQWDQDTVIKSQGFISCLLYTSPSPRDRTRSRMPSSA